MPQDCYFLSLIIEWYIINQLKNDDMLQKYDLKVRTFQICIHIDINIYASLYLL